MARVVHTEVRTMISNRKKVLRVRKFGFAQPIWYFAHAALGYSIQLLCLRYQSLQLTLHSLDTAFENYATRNHSVYHLQLLLQSNTRKFIPLLLSLMRSVDIDLQNGLRRA